MVPLSTLVDMQPSTGPEDTRRFSEYRSFQIIALPLPGCSTGDAMNAIAAVGSEVLRRDMGFSWKAKRRERRTGGKSRAAHPSGGPRAGTHLRPDARRRRNVR